jgi:hypothetical protein
MNKNTLKAAIKNHSEVVLADQENALTYLVEQGFSEDEAQEVFEAITATEEKPAKEKPAKEKPAKEKENLGGNILCEVWQLDQLTNERLKLIKTVKGQPHYIEMLNEQKFNTKLEYVEVK